MTKSKNTVFRRISDAKVDLNFFIHFFCFLSVLFIGADRFGLDVGINLRLDQLFIALFVLLLIVKNAFRFTCNPFAIAFALTSLVSALFAFSPLRGLLFYFSIVYNLVFLFYGFACYVREYGMAAFLKIFRATCFVQFFLLMIQALLKVTFNFEFSFLPSYGIFEGVYRFQLWFYEPSYLATYITLWFTFAFGKFLLQRDRGYLVDLICSLLMFVVCTATTGFLAIAFGVAAVYLVWLFKRFTLWKLLVPFALLLVGIPLVRLLAPSVFDVFVGRLFNQSLDVASGGRVSAWKETIDVFLSSPLFGVGPGCYGLFLGMDAGHVPSNVSLELLATLGIFGFVCFYGLTLSLCIGCAKIYFREKSNRSRTLCLLAIALLVFTVILQINQGYLRLYHWMFFGVLWGGIRSCREKEKTGGEL